MLELIGTKKFMGSGTPFLRRQDGEIPLPTLPPVHVVNISWLFYKVAGHVVQISIPVSFIQDLPRLLLQVPDLLSDDCQLAAGICPDKVIGLGQKITARTAALQTVLGQLWSSSRYQQSWEMQELSWQPRA